MYLTYADYKSMGGALDELKFNRAEKAAERKIDRMTYSRLQNEIPVRQTVQDLVFELIERDLLGLGGREITSESNDGRSESYESNQGKAEKLIRDYLQGEKDGRGVPLFYAGNI